MNYTLSSKPNFRKFKSSGMSAMYEKVSEKYCVIHLGEVSHPPATRNLKSANLQKNDCKQEKINKK